MSFTRKIVIGLLLGIATGLAVGELVAPLQLVAEGFVRLLQMTVLPYVTLSIIASLGALTPVQARALGLRGGAVLAGLWVIAFAVTCLIPLTFPPAETASFFSTTLLEARPPFDFVGLYIPANPFYALANNVVPAVVLFSVVVGVALIGVEPKTTLLDVLATARTVIARATHAVVGLTPYGLFAISAVAAGTLTIDQLQRIQVYLIAYIAAAVLVALWILPGLVAVLTGIRMRDLFGRTRDQLIVAFVAGDLFIVLPGLIEACKDLLARRAEASPLEPAGGAQVVAAGPDIVVPVSFNFPHTGKLLSLSFIPFAAWFADAPLRPQDYPQLFGAGLLSFFGSLNSAVPFLLDLFHVPADTFQLFLATGVINSRFGTLVAAMHTVAVGLLGSVLLERQMRWNLPGLARFGALTVGIVGAVFVTLRILFGTVMQQEFAGADVLYSMRPILGGEPAAYTTTPPPATDRGTTDVLESVRSRGTLRVAVLPDRMPFVFANRDGRLVGMDVELATVLAGDLGVHAEFVELDYPAMASALTTGACDIAMSGVAITPDRGADLLFSRPYLDETLAFVTRDHLRDRFVSWSAIAQLGRVRIGMPDLPAYRRVLAARTPNLELVPLHRMEEFFRPDDGLMGYVLPAERGSVLTLLHPAYSVVVPQPDTIKLPLGYPVARRDQRWVSFVDTWLELKRRDGTLDALYKHWILGRRATDPQPRWSLIHNVLGWTH